MIPEARQSGAAPRRPTGAPPNPLKASIIDLTFIVWAAIVPVLFPSRLLSSDGDFARHLRMGELILQRGPFFTDDLAYTHSGPFLTTEWFSQITWTLAYRVGGLAGDAILAGLIIGFTYALVVLFLRRCDVDPFLAYVAGVLSAVLGAPHWVARPHLFTFLALAVLLHLALAPGRRRLWFFIPLFILWANFHGGFILGLVLLGALAVGDMLEAIVAPGGSEQRREWLDNARFHATAAALGITASSINPMGLGLLVRVYRHMQNAYLLSATSEFRSLDFHGVYGKVMIIVIALIITALSVRSRRPSWPHLAVILLMLASALIAARNAPLFGMIAVPLLAVEFNSEWKTAGFWMFKHVRTVFEDGERSAVRWRWAPWVAFALIILAANKGKVAGKQVVTGGFDETQVPVAATQRARAAALEGRIFNYFVWGGYLLWQWPEQRIYIDGMTDFLGNDVLASYIAIESLEPGWLATLDQHKVSVVIMPPQSRLVYALKGQNNWQVWYEDNVATILTRSQPPAFDR